MEGFDEPDWSEFATDDIQILEQTRHGKKLKRGVLAGNHFKLILSNIEGDSALWQENLKRVQQLGMPNYFGEQRFGHRMGNLDKVDYWFSTGKAPKNVFKKVFIYRQHAHGRLIWCLQNELRITVGIRLYWVISCCYLARKQVCFWLKM